MDLNLLAYIVLFALASIGVDTALHPVSVVLDSAVPNHIASLSADPATINQILKYEVDRVSSTPSVLAAPVIRVGDNPGVGMAIAEAVNMKSVALALQTQLGNQPEEMKLTLLAQDGKIRMLVSGASPGGRIDTPPFQILLTMEPGETLPALVHRAAIAGLSKIDPYITTLHVLQDHLEDGDFTEVEALIDEVKAALPPTPRSTTRSLFENLQGIISLFRHDPRQAETWFKAAAQSDEDNRVAVLNVAFVELHLGEYQDAVARIRRAMEDRPPKLPILAATAYIELAAGLLGLHDTNGADQALAMAIEIYPQSAAGYELWSAVKREKSDIAAADRLHLKALSDSRTFANYAEVAALYFVVPSRENQPITRSPFVNPNKILFNRTGRRQHCAQC